jgi:hypothetical protein
MERHIVGLTLLGKNYNTTTTYVDFYLSNETSYQSSDRIGRTKFDRMIHNNEVGKKGKFLTIEVNGSANVELYSMGIF